MPPYTYISSGLLDIIAECSGILSSEALRDFLSDSVACLSLSCHFALTSQPHHGPVFTLVSPCALILKALHCWILKHFYKC